MWIALALPLLVLPALLAFSRFEQAMLTAPRVRGARGGSSPAGERPAERRTLSAG